MKIFKNHTSTTLLKELLICYINPYPANVENTVSS